MKSDDGYDRSNNQTNVRNEDETFSSVESREEKRFSSAQRKLSKSIRIKFSNGGVSIGYKEYTCPICGNVFVGWEIVQPVYCSATCRDAADALHKAIEYYESRHAAEKS